MQSRPISHTTSTESIQARPWRVGRSTGRNIYVTPLAGKNDDDNDIGKMDTRELATFVVAAVNGRAALVNERDAALAALRDLLWIIGHEELRGMEGYAMIHGARYSPEFLAECTRRREAAEALVATIDA